MKERIIRALETEIDKYKKINEKMMNALIPCWTEIEQNRGYILGLRSAIMIINNMTEETRDCENCVNHTANGCTVWECRFEPQESEDTE